MMHFKNIINSCIRNHGDSVKKIVFKYYIFIFYS